MEHNFRGVFQTVTFLLSVPLELLLCRPLAAASAIAAAASSPHSCSADRLSPPVLALLEAGRWSRMVEDLVMSEMISIYEYFKFKGFALYLCV